jgi:hypothetical protein
MRLCTAQAALSYDKQVTHPPKIMKFIHVPYDYIWTGDELDPSISL